MNHPLTTRALVLAGFAGINLPGMPATSPGMGPAKQDSLCIVALPFGGGAPQPYAVELAASNRAVTPTFFTGREPE